MDIKHFYDSTTSTLTYIVYDRDTHDAVIIDPVLDYDPIAGSIATVNIEQLVDYVQSHNLQVHYLLETHAHADHLSGAHVLKKRFFPNANIAIGEQITAVQKTFAAIFNLQDSFDVDGRQFDKLLSDGEMVSAGSLSFKVLSTPGHTPACVSYLFEDVLFVGDAIFMPDFGAGRCDFPAGSAQDLYRSVMNKIYQLPDQTKVFVGHDYPGEKRDLKYESTVGEQKKSNIQLSEQTKEAEFVEYRTKRDQTLKVPRLLYQSLQVNIAAGELPKAESNGCMYLKMPLFIEGE